MGMGLRSGAVLSARLRERVRRSALRIPRRSAFRDARRAESLRGRQAGFDRKRISAAGGGPMRRRSVQLPAAVHGDALPHLRLLGTASRAGAHRFLHLQGHAAVDEARRSDEKQPGLRVRFAESRGDRSAESTHEGKRGRRGECVETRGSNDGSDRGVHSRERPVQ